MGFMDEYYKALEDEGKKSSSSGGSGGGKSSGSSFMDEYNKAIGTANRTKEKTSSYTRDIAPLSDRLASRMTVGKKKKKKEEEERSWFKKGLFEDGYDIGDISRTILGTATDVLENVGSGIIGMGEKAVDSMAYIAPYAANGQFYQNGGIYTLEQQEQHEKVVEQSKKDLGKFIAKDLYDEEKIARAIISDPARKIGIDSEAHSVFGEKSDSLIQSGGQLLATAGLAAAGLPWWATTGVTSFGSEAENAMNQGANYEQAGVSAAISAGSEILSEKLSGGISFGGKTWDDSLTNMLARGISNKIGRTAAKLTSDMAGEGIEEIVSQIASNIGSSLYKEENLKDLLFSEEAFDEYLESFIGGAALGGVAGSYNAVKSNKKGVDYASGLTENEQKVVDKLYKDETKSLEKEGKVTQKEKSKIYDSILKDMERGYISIDIIEEVLGGESYTAYRDTVDSEDAILQEYEELGEKPNATPKDYARYTELTEKVKNIHSNSQRDTLRAKLNEEVMGLVKGDRLAESYNERYRSSQKFEADVTHYDAKQQAVVQKAIDSGILNNSNRTHEFVDFVSKISADTGVLFDFSNTAKIREAGFAVEGQTVDGFITKDGITVNIDSPKSRQFVVGHEITHALEGTELYDALRKSVFDYAKMKNQYDARMDSIQKRYKEGTDFEAELTADLVGEYIFSDTDFINNLSTQNRNVFQKVYDEIKYLCKVATAGSKEARELEKVKRAFEKAYREGGKTQGDTKYSVSDSAGKELTAEQQEYFKDSKARDENGNLIKVYHSSPTAGFTVFDGAEGKGNYKYSEYGDSITFFADNKNMADSYSPSDEKVDTKKLTNLADAREWLGDISAGYVEIRENNGAFEVFDSDDNSAILEYDSEEELLRNLKRDMQEELGDPNAGGQYEGYVNLKNPLIVDAQGRPWSRVTDVFSQEVYDKFQSLTEEERAALIDLAEWEDFSLFRKEISDGADLYEMGRENDHTRIMASIAEKMYDTDPFVDPYQLFDVAADAFSEEVVKEKSTIQLSTNDYVERALQAGTYDGVIIKNVIDYGGHAHSTLSSPPGNDYIVFNSNQFKAADNLKPTDDADIRYSLSDSNGRELSNEQSIYFKDSKVRDENGCLKVMYHGTPNGEFTIFRDGTYFTDNKEYADRYQNPSASSISTGKVAKNPKTFEVYLDIKKPFDINDAEAREIYINDYIKGGNAMGINPYLSDAEYAKINSIDWTEGEDLREFLIENEYDYDGLVLDEGGTGGYGDEVQSRGKSYVVFSPEQVKNIDNLKPSADPDIRFSLSNPVEETKDLMALHNLTSEKLLKSLKLGGLPMPSVAIAKAKDGHSEFGEISLILPRETIDPKTSSRNKLYSGDAWTPTYPKVEYKPNGKVLKDIEKKVSKLVPYEVQDALGNLMFDTDNARDYLDRYNGNMVEAYKKNDSMKYAYLKDTGSEIELPMKEQDLVRYGTQSNAAVRYFSGKLVNGLQTVEHYQNMGARELVQDKSLTEAVADAQNFDVLRTLEPGSQEYLEYERNPVFLAEDVTFRDIDNFLSASRKLFTYGVQQTVDRNAARDMLKDIDQTAYEGWLENLFSGVVEKEGIRNEKDLFTPSGNRRSFEALHYENTLENVVKAMREKGEKGIGFGGGNIFGAATTEFPSVDEMKQASGRLQQMSDEEYQEIKDGFTQRFLDLASNLPKNKNSWTATDDAANVLTEAVTKYQTKRGIANYLRRELDGWATYSPQVVDDLIELVNDIRSMPTGYFEAKPQRAVGFDEVGVFVIPYDADVKLKQELLNKGYSIAEYDPKVEGDRQRVVNQFEEYKFSLSNVGEQHTPDSLSALRLDAPVAENSTTQPETQLMEENSTVSEDESVRAMFPDDGVNELEELEKLEIEEAELLGVMEAYAGVGDIEAVNKLLPEHESIRERIKELQQHETDRADSLVDSEEPPEMDAPISTKTENYNPWANTTIYDIDRSTRSYSDRNPGARTFLEEAALGFAYDVNNSTHGEKWYNDELYYATGGEQGFGGTSRHTTSDIEELKDAYGYTWDQLKKAAEDVANGDLKSVAAKRVELLCHKRLVEGYTDVDGRRYEPNQEYITFLNETFANEQRAGNFDSLLEDADKYAPPVDDFAPSKPLHKENPDSFDAPVFESNDKNTVKGQTTMFEPEKKTPPTGGKVANVLTNEPKTPKRRSKFWSLVKEHVLDNGMVFEDYSKETGNREIEAKWNFIRYSQSRAQRLIGNGTEGVKALKDIKKEVEKSGKTGQFYDYLYHKHNVDRMSLEDRFDNTPNKAVFGDSVTSEMSQRQVEQYEAKNPEFMQWAEDVYGYMNHLRGLLVENGVISQETADLWEDMYPHYVPIRRADQDGLNVNVPLDSRRTTVNNPVKRATGGNQDILPLFDTMAQRTVQTYKAIARNNFGIELKNQLGSVVDTNVETVDEVIDSIDTDDALLKPGEKGMNPTFTVFENGERVEFEITEEMYEAMKPKSEAMQHRNKILNTASNVFRGLTTQYSIPFMATNAIKDAQDVLINSQHPAKTYANFPRAWYQQLFNGKYYQEYIKNGGEDNTYFDNETNTFDEGNWFKKGFDFITKPVTEANNFIELTPRLAEYIASREAGRSIEVSMLDAARVTTNFAAGGDVTKFLNANGATFLNASVQGAVQQVRNIREAHHKGLMGYVGLATKFALAGLPTVLLNNLVWDDDEDYEELADYVKQDYYVIGKYDDGKFIRIPKGRTVAVIQNAIEQVQNAATGDDEVDLKAFLTLAVNNLAPNNPLENNILAPIGQVMANKTWYGEELVPSRLQDLPAAEQYDEKTDDFSRKLGEKLDISPYKINYLLNQYSGGLGDMILPVMTPRAESGDDSKYGFLTAPLRDKFTTDSVINSQVVSDYYDTKDALAVKANSGKATEDDYFRDLYMDTVGWELSDLYQQKREIQNSDMPDSEKYAKSRELQEQIVERMKQSLNSYDNINASGIYAEIGDKRFNKDADSGKWYEIKPKNADGSDNWYYQKEQEVTKGLGISYEEYWNNREEYNYAYDKPGRYAIAKAVGGYDTYMEHYDVLENWQSDSYLGADKDSKGNSISGTRKKKVLEYINGLDIDYGERIILYRTVYSSKTDKRKYNQDIIDYLNERDDIDYQQMKSILEELDMEVDSEGYITW